MIKSTIPARWYWDPDIYAEERKNIFSRQWICVGREEEISNVKQYFTASPAGFPIFVLRAKDGNLRGFHNVCRHRAAKLLCERSGNYESLTCPYHGWQYNDDGLLLNAPHFGANEDFYSQDFSLFSLQVDTWSGMIFVNMDLNGPKLLEWLGPLADAVEKTAPRSIKFYRDVEFHVSCNWKNYVDNYQEGYHIPLIHPGLHQDLDWRRYNVINHDGGSLHQSPARAKSTHPGSFGWHFPNFAFNSYHHGLSLLRIEPLSANETRLFYSFFRPSDMSEDDFKKIYDYGIKISKEDQKITPMVQKNLESGVYYNGPLSPKHETGVSHFHELIRIAISRDIPPINNNIFP